MLATISLPMISCAPIMPLTQSEIEKVKTIAILDDLPEYPRYNIHGFTPLTSTFEKIQDKRFREKVVATASNYLQSKGYKVIVISKNNNAGGMKIDLLLDITGVPLGNNQYEHGYGVSQVYLFGSATAPYTYASLAVFPSLSRDATRAGYRTEKSTSLTKKELAKNWESLPQNDKEEIIKALNSNIEEVTTELMKKLGI
jgi:hypothetical protein